MNFRNLGILEIKLWGWHSKWNFGILNFENFGKQTLKIVLWKTRFGNFRNGNLKKKITLKILRILEILGMKFLKKMNPELGDLEILEM